MRTKVSASAKPDGYNPASCSSETEKYRHITSQYCFLDNGHPGVGVDIASQGASVVPWAIGFDLPVDEFNIYCANHPAKGPIQLRGHADKLPFDNESLDFVYSSHLLEDYLDWTPVLNEWSRVLRPNGYMIILVPDKQLWNMAIEKGQTPNCAHKHESRVGELSEYAESLRLSIVEDCLTDQFDGDYSVIFVGRKY
jgi:SAM-dependent methyltransferase